MTYIFVDFAFDHLMELLFVDIKLIVSFFSSF